MPHRYSNVVGFDDAPFNPKTRGDVLVVGAVYAGLRLEGVISARVRRDGSNATGRLIRLLSGSRFADQLQLVMLQGIAFAGFNVVDVQALHEATRLPVLVIARRRPDLDSIRDALLGHVPGGARKWRLIEATGPMEALAGVYVQRAGISRDEAGRLIRRTAVNSVLPEPLRTAHLIAGGVILGESRHRP
jgi:endonuclease V-like protein UPF0215 family